MSVINSIIILGALPALNAFLAMLLLDRQLGTYFFRPIGGGDAVLWEHFFHKFYHFNVDPGAPTSGRDSFVIPPI